MGAAFWRATAKGGIGDFAGLHGYGPGDSAGDGRDRHEALPDGARAHQEQVSGAGGRGGAQLCRQRKVLRSGMFEDIWIQPAAGDAGGALGAAYAVWHIREGKGGSSTDVPMP